jgi:Grx4 family monothiol glutaredoxin
MENTSISNSNLENLKFPLIKTKRQYIDNRLKLEKTFLLFFAFDESANAMEDNQTWFEFLEELQSQFSDYMRIILFSNQSEGKLIDVLKKDDEEISQITYPRAVLCHPHLSEPQLYTDLEPFELYRIVEEAAEFYKTQFEKEKQIVFDKITKILNSYPVVVFIKGTPHDPFCKFSRSFIEILKGTGIRYKSFDIFRDESLRNYLRLYSGWKTYPQMYINSKILGGVDILKDLVEKGEFLSRVPVECKKEGCITFIENYLKENPLVVFGKGSGENIKCKSSAEAYEILKKNNFNYKVFDVLKDEMLREVLKEQYGYKYYPQVFVNGKFLGGIKFLREIEKNNKILEHVRVSFNINILILLKIFL